MFQEDSLLTTRAESEGNGIHADLNIDPLAWAVNYDTPAGSDFSFSRSASPDILLPPVQSDDESGNVHEQLLWASAYA